MRLEDRPAATYNPILIRKIEVYPIDVRLTFQRTLSKGPVSKASRDKLVGAPILLRVESNEGVVGFGQVRPPTPWLGETTDSIVSAVRHYYGPALLGADPSARQDRGSRLDAVLPGNSVAQAGLDIALHDLTGKTLGLPVYAVLGGSRRSIPLDWSVSLNPRDAMIDEAVRAVRDHGVHIICIKVGAAGQWTSDVETFRAVRAAVGEDVEIGIDPNEGYDLATAIRVARALENDRIAYIEQPLTRVDVNGLRDLRAAAGVPILLDESAITVVDALRLAEAGACSGFVLKLWKSGGFANAVKMAVVAEAAGLAVTVGGVAHGSVLEAAACAHLYSSLPVRAMAGEFVLGLNVVDRDPVVQLPQAFAIRDGSVEPPDGPGLGVDVDMSVVNELALGHYVVE